MSRSKKDKRGGHTNYMKGMHSCGCCEVLSPKVRSMNRTERERESMRQELRDCDLTTPNECGTVDE